MSLAAFLEKFGRTLFERPLTSHAEEPPELAEIRLAILDKVREKSYRAGGRKVFPHDLIRVELRGLDSQTASALNGGFLRDYLAREARESLRADGCRFPENLRLEIEAAAGLPQPGVEWIAVEIASQSPAAEARGPARLVVREGAANLAEIRLEKDRTNIGRTVDVYRDGGLSRRNDLAFAEETDINRSVSREHAHIMWDKAAGECRLFNDRWYRRGEEHSSECGIWVVRRGMSQEVHRGGRGFRLEPGDEIHFGRAIAVFEWD